MRSTVILAAAVATAALAGSAAAHFHGQQPLANIAFVTLVVSAAVAIALAGAKLRRRFRSATSATCVALAVALAISASAAAATLPKPTWITRADAACRSIDARVAAIPQPKVNPAQPRRPDLPAIASYLHRLEPLLAAEVRQVAALPHPATDAADAEAFVRNAGRSVAALRASAGAAAGGHLLAYRASFARDNRYGSQASAVAKRLGLRVCGQ